MSDSSESPWSDDPNVSQIPSWVRLEEKESFAAFLIGAISYGIVMALFFRCMAALLSPANPMRRGTRGALVAHTMALYSFFTVPLGGSLSYLSTAYVDNREFPGNDKFPPGPIGYYNALGTNATGLVFTVTFPLNQWLADGLLLYRCYLIYSMNHWFMTFPYLMYLASVALGIASIYQVSGIGYYTVAAINITTAYYSICLSLNILLTLMIVIRLMVHIRSLGKAAVISGGSDQPHTAAATVVTMLIESYALYAAALLSYVVSWGTHSLVLILFSGAVSAIQVIAPYLITLRVAKRRAMTTESISGTAESIRFRSQGSTDADGSLPDGDPVNSTEVNGETAREIVAGDESAIEEVRL